VRCAPSAFSALPRSITAVQTGRHRTLGASARSATPRRSVALLTQARRRRRCCSHAPGAAAVADGHRPARCRFRLWLSHKSNALEISPTTTAGATATPRPHAESTWAAGRSLDRPTTKGRRRRLMRQPSLDPIAPTAARRLSGAGEGVGRGDRSSRPGRESWLPRAGRPRRRDRQGATDARLLLADACGLRCGWSRSAGRSGGDGGRRAA
jgi:hypothetical protein